MKRKLETILEKISLIGGDSRNLVFESTATESEIVEIEKKINSELPTDFRTILLKVSSHCEFKWFLPSNFLLPNELRQIFCGELHWGIQFIETFQSGKNSWVQEVFPNTEDEYDKVWHNKFVFQEVGNGDYLSIDLLEENYGKIVYLSHDDGEGHGYIMADSFSELLTNWTELACVGGEDWQWLPFVNDKSSGINPDCKNAETWKNLIGL
jgi:cell wall assembly regulator SMI1